MCMSRTIGVLERSSASKGTANSAQADSAIANLAGASGALCEPEAKTPLRLVSDTGARQIAISSFTAMKFRAVRACLAKELRHSFQVRYTTHIVLARGKVVHAYVAVVLLSLLLEAGARANEEE